VPVIPIRPKKTAVPEPDGRIQQVREILASMIEDGDPRAKRQARRMLKAAGRQIGGYMRLWDAREREIEEDLEADAQISRNAGKPIMASVDLCLRVLRAARDSLGGNDQRMTISQAELAKNRSLTPGQVSAAFAALARVGAVLMQKRMGRSVSWEIDGRYASRLDDAALGAAITAQEKAQREDAADARKQAALDKIGHKVLPWPDRNEGTIEDERQPPLV
jgi:hypothetical protein